MTDTEHNELFAAISGHYLTEQLPSQWVYYDDDRLEEWFKEYALELYEYWDWKDVYAQIEEVTHTVTEFMAKEKNQ